jgi:hypothetical protein
MLIAPSFSTMHPKMKFNLICQDEQNFYHITEVEENSVRNQIPLHRPSLQSYAVLEKVKYTSDCLDAFQKNFDVINGAGLDAYAFSGVEIISTCPGNGTTIIPDTDEVFLLLVGENHAIVRYSCSRTQDTRMCVFPRLLTEKGLASNVGLDQSW